MPQTLQEFQSFSLSSLHLVTREQGLPFATMRKLDRVFHSRATDSYPGIPV